MAIQKIVIHYKNKKGQRRAIIPAKGVVAVFTSQSEATAKLGMQVVRRPVSGAKIVEENDENDSALAGEEGPGVCCVIDEQLFCW